MWLLLDHLSPGTSDLSRDSGGRVEGKGMVRGGEPSALMPSNPDNKPGSRLVSSHRVRDKEVQAREVDRWAGVSQPPKGGRRGPEVPGRALGEQEGGTGGPHPSSKLADRQDTRIPELCQAAASRANNRLAAPRGGHGMGPHVGAQHPGASCPPAPPQPRWPEARSGPKPDPLLAQDWLLP